MTDRMADARATAIIFPLRRLLLLFRRRQRTVQTPLPTTNHLRRDIGLAPVSVRSRFDPMRFPRI